RTRRLNLARHLRLGSHLHPAWTAKQVALLGALADEEAAAQTGRFVSAVRLKREKLGIPNLPGRGEWEAEELVLVGRVTDGEIARRTGRTARAIQSKRSTLGLPAVPARAQAKRP